MKVLITGGAGFIGSHLAEHLLAAGNGVRVLDNLSTGKRENLPAHSRLAFVQGDIRDRSLVADTARGMDAIVHLDAALECLNQHSSARRRASVVTVKPRKILLPECG